MHIFKYERVDIYLIEMRILSSEQNHEEQKSIQYLQRQLSEQTSSNTGFYFFLLVVALVAGFIYYDRRQNYHYLLRARQFILFWYERIRINIARLREKKQEEKKLKKNKTAVQEVPQSSKSYGALINEKTLVDTDRNSMKETTGSLPEEFGNMDLEEQQTEVDLKGVFGPDKKNKDKHKSKSKLRGRVQIKKSQLEAEALEEEEAHASTSFSEEVVEQQPQPEPEPEPQPQPQPEPEPAVQPEKKQGKEDKVVEV